VKATIIRRRKARSPFSLAPALLLTAVVHAPHAYASHGSPPSSVAIPGDFQSELGCLGDWQPDCPNTDLNFGFGVWSATFSIPAGSWEYKVALNDSWDENYGRGGVQDGDNLILTLAAQTDVTFTYDPVSHVVTSDAQPLTVTAVGSFQEELGCPGDWQPECGNTHLSFDPEDRVWQAVFNIPAGEWEYKVALNDSWDENYGRLAAPNGPNIVLSLGGSTDVKFYYDNATNWITDNHNSVIAVAPGDFQSKLGCSGDWQPWCLRSWLQDTNGDGIYGFQTRKLPAGDYEVKVAYNESWDENYGAGGVQNGANIAFNVPSDGSLVVFNYDPDSHILDIGGDLPVGNLSEARAYWLAEDTLAWNVPAGSRVQLHYSATGALTTTPDGVIGGDSIDLIPDGVVGGALADKFRHLSGLPVFRVSGGDLSMVPDLLRQQIVLSATDAGGTALDATALQIAGVLDDLYTYDGNLGVVFHGAKPTIRVWAPTARSVRLHVFDDSDNASKASAIVDMNPGDAGTWSTTGDASWNRKYYLFEVEVFVRSTGQVEHNLVTDPYSLSLSTNSRRSQIVDLDDDDLKPRHWDKLKKPKLDAPEDIALYELHVRDFSMHDDSVPAELGGTFKAFSLPFSHGARHLRVLSKAGLSHVHLLPAFDCATIEEDRSLQKIPGNLSSYPSDSLEQQAAIDAIRDEDGFNWCYDPFHYTVPEGSYSTNPDGPTRIREFRVMIAGLNRLGLRTVMDVVYNHTSGSLQGEKSVLDKIVPGYYHRLNDAGFIETSSCCANTASEHNMMEKLMLDSLRVWATAYKVDGFRFDLMGHHSRANIEKARDLLQSLTPRDDGVDGRDIYLYGEGWNFGEVENNARFEQASQVNMGDDTGVGTFNDRIRDAVRGGGPFDSGEDHVRRQGFINGLYYDPNALNTGSSTERDELLRLAAWVRIGLAGSIAGFQFVDRFGDLVQAQDVDYFGQPGAGYTSDPQEVINYAEAHDNETLFDINQYKLPIGTSTADRVRVQNLGNSIVALSQGVPFFHAGQDLLRSKSMDRNSYNSGDWFNILDFSFDENGWGRGMPPQGENSANAAVVQPLLANPDLGVDKPDIRRANKHIREMLKIRTRSELFRLRTGQDVMERVEFHNTGPSQVPGLIVMSLRGEHSIEIVVIFNAGTSDQTFFLDTAGDEEFELHEVLENSHDPVVRQSLFDHDDKAFFVPARTTAVFVADKD
jgi:pullulanase-type alpha-1,6-glucosidase